MVSSYYNSFYGIFPSQKIKDVSKFPNNRRRESSSYRQGEPRSGRRRKSPSSRRGEPRSGRRRKSPSSRRGEPQSGGRRKGRRQRPRDLHPKTQASTLRPWLGAWVGSVGSEKSTGKLLRKNPCLEVIWLSYPYPFLAIDELI